MPYISVKHLSVFLDTPVSTIYDWVQRGIIPAGVAVTIGGRILINQEKLESLLSSEITEKPKTSPMTVIKAGNPSDVVNTIAKLYNSVQSNPAFHARKE